MPDIQTSIGEDRETRLRLLAIYAPLGPEAAIDRAQAAYEWVKRGAVHFGVDPGRPGSDRTVYIRQGAGAEGPSDTDEKIIDPVDIPASLASMGPRQRTVLFALTRADDWAAMSGQTLEKATGIARQQVEQILVALRKRGLIERRFVDGQREIRVRPTVLDVLEARNDPEPPMAPAAPVAVPAAPAQAMPAPPTAVPIPPAPSPKPVADRAAVPTKVAPPPAVPARRAVAPHTATRDAPAVDYLRSCGSRVLPSTNGRWLIDGDLDPVGRDELWRRARRLADQRGDTPPRPAVEIPQ